MINNGIKYDELTKEQRDELEKVWDYEKMLKGIDPNKEYHRDIEGNEIFRYLMPVSLIVGVGIGFFGSLATVRKHLRV